jgi:hypothetical protein
MRTPLSLLFVLLAFALTPAVSETVLAADAKNHVGENTTVCGKVASERTATSSRGEPTFINLDAAYQNQVFTILVWGDDRKSVGEYATDGVSCLRDWADKGLSRRA